MELLHRFVPHHLVVPIRVLLLCGVQLLAARFARPILGVANVAALGVPLVHMAKPALAVAWVSLHGPLDEITPATFAPLVHSAVDVRHR